MVLPSPQQIEAVLFDLLGRNEILVRDQTDLGITLFATPGPIGVQTSSPTLAIHLNPLDHPRIRQRREHGQALVVTDVQQPSDASLASIDQSQIEDPLLLGRSSRAEVG